ncbi:MAG: hypothetical protein P9M15_06360, partial [Candidatus Electryoneaceae bacterium]|nr:hypothetical protein [Candidatus Electryoneaceae bacterium]
EFILDIFTDDRVEVWMLNHDGTLDWLNNYRLEYNLHLPIMKNADVAFERYRLGRQWHCLPPMYIVIDKHGIVRFRDTGQGAITLEGIAELVEELLREE